MYAGRKRRKPVQRVVKQPPPEGAKSNPSKRHRDRLNGELERLASLLPFPEEVTASLDKLSILRLSVSYLRAKNFFSALILLCQCPPNMGGLHREDLSSETDAIAESALFGGALKDSGSSLSIKMRCFAEFVQLNATAYEDEYESNTINEEAAWELMSLRKLLVPAGSSTVDDYPAVSKDPVASKGVTLNNRNGATPSSISINDCKTGVGNTKIPEGELLLQVSLNVVLVITAAGTIFYSSHTTDYFGFHQTDVMHQSVYELVHTEDQQELRSNLHWALNPPATAASTTTQDMLQDVEPDSSSSLVTYNPEQLPPENSSFLERSFVCRFRCLLDNSSGFLALNIQGRLKFLHGQNQKQENGGKAPPQLALFAIATPLQPPSILEIRTKNMIFRTKHKLDFTPLACDAKGKIVLGYTEAELRVRGTGYQFIHAADMLYCAENHVRMMKTGESGLTVFRLLTKENRWKWVQANARLVYKNGKPDYIIATQRPLLDEEGGEHLRKRSMHLPFTYATGEALLYQSNHPIPGFRDGCYEKNGSKSKKSRTDRLGRDGLDPGSLLGVLMSQDESVYVCQPALEPKMSFHSSFFAEQMNFSDTQSSGLHRSWDGHANGMVGPVVTEPGTSFDPLLATLDSLSLESQGVVDADEGTCSNGELFGALEGLGLSAEDLELLLLDERMIRVEMDPERVPTLDDLLTNDEILSYIYDSIEGKSDSAEHGGQASPSTSSAASTAVSLPESNSIPTSDTGIQMQFPQRKPPMVGHTPIVQLSQQMQQYLSMRTSKVDHDWGQQSDHVTNTVVNGELLSAPNRHWTAQDILASAGIQLQHLDTQQSTDGELHQQLCIQKQQCHIKQNTPTLNGLRGIPSAEHSTRKSQCQDYGFSQGLGSNSCLDNSQKALTDTSLESCVDYSLPDIDNGDYPISGSGLFGCGQQRGVEPSGSSFSGINHEQQQEQVQVPLSQVISSLSRCPPPDTSMEQILGMEKTCRQLEHCGVMTSEIPHATSLSKMENGCILNSTYPGDCALPNGDGPVPPTVQIPGPETLSSLPDPAPSSFYL
ncbi:LOW QUALITY PROTEIN: aryl hydrocarbon receptor-like [Pholidichthys leucotaenia]